MNEMNMETSTTLGNLAKALAAAQAKICGAPRDKKNPHTGSMYADLAGVWAACREPLTANEIAVVQTTEPHGMDGVCVVTTLLHSSGEWVRGRLFVPCVGQRKKDGTILPVDAQTFGSALTYARRYALAAIVGVAPEDDDGEAAVKNAREPAPPPPPVTDGIDVEVLLKSLNDAQTNETMSSAVLAISKVAGKLSEADRARIRDAHDNAMRRIAAKVAA